MSDLTGSEYDDMTYPQFIVICLILAVCKFVTVIAWMLYRLRSLLIWTFGRLAVSR